MFRIVLIYCIATALDCTAAHVGRSTTHPTMAELDAAFERSPAPKARDMVGNWVATAFVSTRRFMSSTNGPDFIHTDSTGVRIGNGTLEWQSTMELQNGSVVLVSGPPGGHGEASAVTFDSVGEARFWRDFGADTWVLYRCRMPTSMQMICVNARAPNGDGVELRRVR